MTARQTLIRLAVAITMLGGLGACAVVPPSPGYYRSAPVVVETYPGYRQAPGYGYYDEHRPYYGQRHEERSYYRDERRYQEPVRIPSPFQVHREIRRSLGLPRLPGMP